MANNTINWGIIAPGKIAQQFAQALQAVDRANLYCVASRDHTRAKEFADRFGFETVEQSYQTLIDNPEVDVIYIASPHSLHAEQSTACLQAGKPVLCEKPMTVNAREAEQVFEAARQNNTFYMEAVWTRFMPFNKKIREWIDASKIGDVQLVQANFGFAFSFDPKHRLFNPELAGGALLDLGIYPITIAQMAIQDTPIQVAASAHLGSTGVDESTGITLRYQGGQIANLNASVRATTSNDAWIFGTHGSIHIPQFWCAQSATLAISKNREIIETEHFKQAHRVNGYEDEIEEVHKCLDQSQIESSMLPWSESLSVMKIMDEVREQIGLKYPFETS